jgi:hypothetical protein
VQITKDDQGRLSAQYQYMPSTLRDRLASLSSVSSVPGKEGSRSYKKYKNGMVAIMTRFAGAGITELTIGFPNSKKTGNDGKETVDVVGVRPEALIAMVEAARETSEITNVPVTVKLDKTAEAVLNNKCNQIQKDKINFILSSLEQKNKAACANIACTAAIEKLCAMAVPDTLDEKWVKELKKQIDVLVDVLKNNPDGLNGITDAQSKVLVGDGKKLENMLQKIHPGYNAAIEAAAKAQAILDSLKQAVSNAENEIKLFEQEPQNVIRQEERALLDKQLVDASKALADAKKQADPFIKKRDEMKALYEGVEAVKNKLAPQPQPNPAPGGAGGGV